MAHRNASMSVGQQQSDSLIGSLCREAAALRCRWQQVIDELARCREASLIGRLRQEQLVLQRRRRVLQDSVRQLQRGWTGDPLGLAFLNELTHRPLSC